MLDIVIRKLVSLSSIYPHPFGFTGNWFQTQNAYFFFLLLILISLINFNSSFYFFIGSSLNVGFSNQKICLFVKSPTLSFWFYRELVRNPECLNCFFLLIIISLINFINKFYFYYRLQF